MILRKFEFWFSVHSPPARTLCNSDCSKPW